MIRSAQLSTWAFSYLVFSCLGIGLIAHDSHAQPREPLPMRHKMTESDTLEDIAKKFSLDSDIVHGLNPTIWATPNEVLLIDMPRNAEEAMLLLEEAKRFEVLGGVGARKARILYRGILIAAGLIPSEDESWLPVEMSSETVAQTLLAWGKIHENRDLNQADWAYSQVQIYFPDMKNYHSQAALRMDRLDDDDTSLTYPPPPSGLNWFPFSPHVIVDIDTRRLESQLVELNLLETFATLGDHPNVRVQEKYEQSSKRYSEGLEILSHMKSLHLGGWVDPDIYGVDPGEGIRRMNWVLVGELESSIEEFSASLELPSTVDTRGGFEIRDLGKGTFLASEGAHVLLANETILKYLIDRKPPFDHPLLGYPDSAYRNARIQTGSGSSIFGYVDIEGFMKGPALAFARNGDPDDEDSLFLSLLLSGLIGVNSIQGFAFALDCDHDTLFARASLQHQKGGILAFFAGDPCPSQTARFHSEDTQGFLQVLRPCTPNVDGLLDVEIDRILGSAGMVYRAHYEALLGRIEKIDGIRFDPIALFQSGLLSDVTIGLRIPGGMVPIPNVLIAAPTTLAISEIRHLEDFFTQDSDEEVEFIEEPLADHWYRHAVIPIDLPLFLDLSYTLYDGTLLISNNVDLLNQAIRKDTRSSRLQSTPDYQEFQEEWFPSNHLSLYFSKELTRRFARLGRALVSAHVGDPESEPFARIFQSQMDRLIERTQYSGFGIRLGEEGVNAKLQIRPFRYWLSTLLTFRWMNRMEQWNRGN